MVQWFIDFWVNRNRWDDKMDKKEKNLYHIDMLIFSEDKQNTK